MLLYSSGFSADSVRLTSAASALSMFDCRSEKPLSRAFICGSLPRNSAGIGASSPLAGFEYLSKAINAGLPAHR